MFYVLFTIMYKNLIRKTAEVCSSWNVTKVINARAGNVFQLFQMFFVGHYSKKECGAAQNITGIIKKQTSDKRSEERRRDLYRQR